jgi:hypothetical protein
LGYILGDFKNSSGHPDENQDLAIEFCQRLPTSKSSQASANLLSQKTYFAEETFYAFFLIHPMLQ